MPRLVRGICPDKPGNDGVRGEGVPRQRKPNVPLGPRETAYAASVASSEPSAASW